MEARNGHMKTVYQLLDKTLSLVHAVNLGDFYRICGAFKAPIYMADATPELARQMLEQAQIENRMQRRVLDENLHRRARQNWVHINENHAPQFPVLTLQDLKRLTYGIYQENPTSKINCREKTKQF